MTRPALAVSSVVPSVPAPAAGGRRGAAEDRESARPERELPPRPGTRRLLLVEDSVGDARLILELILESGRAWELVHVQRVGEAVEALRGEDEYDCVLLDLSLADADGTDAVIAVQRQAPHCPVVVLTHRQDEELAEEALALGAQDFLSKKNLTPELLTRAVRYAMERKATELKLAHQASHDALTGLPNRELFADRLKVALADRHRPVAVLFVDLDDFKIINDSLGHFAGDQVLVEVADRLLAAVRGSDTVARFAGDEFTVLCPRLHSPEEAVTIAERVVAELSRPLSLAGRYYSINGSVGLAISTSTDDDGHTLLSQADAALHRAKALGKNRYTPFDSSLRLEAMARLTTQRQLGMAIERNQLRLAYQPEVDPVTGRVVVVEALLRWQHSSRGLLSPDEFIGIAEASGLILPIGQWVLERALADRAEWAHTGRFAASDGSLPVVAVNVSAVQLADPEFVTAVQEALARTGTPPEALQLEITESAVMDRESLVSVSAALRGLGVGIAIDDFGTGHSSLTYLKAFPASTVKIDRSFVAGLGVDPIDDALVAAVIGVAHASGMTVVAEGVETEAQRDALVGLGCDLAQGFWFARPS